MHPSNGHIRECHEKDLQSICDIYNYYIQNTIITFEETVVSTGEMHSRMNAITPYYPWFVYEENNHISGFAYASPWRVRSAYRYSVESTVYIDSDFTGCGIGRKLYSALIAFLQTKSIHSMIGGISLPNETSVAFHEKLGFQKVAHFHEVGWKFDRWIDVGYWELLLNT